MKKFHEDENIFKIRSRLVKNSQIFDLNSSFKNEVTNKVLILKAFRCWKLFNKPGASIMQIHFLLIISSRFQLKKLQHTNFDSDIF